MLATLRSAAVFGIEAYPVHVEVDVSFGFPSFSMVGLPDAAVRESRDRVRAAIRNSGFEFPPHRITVNLAPADVRKAGSSFDLPIALGLLAGSGCGGLPPDAPLPQNVAAIQLGNPVCPDVGGNVELPGVIPVGLQCTMTAEVQDEWGIPILEPDVFWNSSDSRILTANGASRTATVHGRITGTVTVTASNRQGNVMGTRTIQVVASR